MKVVYGLFLILNIQIFFMYSADECSLLKLKELQQMSLVDRVGFSVDEWALRELHVFKGRERIRLIGACCFCLKNLDKDLRIDILENIDLKKIMEHVERLKKERRET